MHLILTINKLPHLVQHKTRLNQVGQNCMTMQNNVELRSILVACAQIHFERAHCSYIYVLLYSSQRLTFRFYEHSLCCRETSLYSRRVTLKISNKIRSSWTQCVLEPSVAPYLYLMPYILLLTKFDLKRSQRSLNFHVKSRHQSRMHTVFTTITQLIF